MSKLTEVSLEDFLKYRDELTRAHEEIYTTETLTNRVYRTDDAVLGWQITHHLGDYYFLHERIVQGEAIQ